MPLDHHLIHRNPIPLFMGELPRDYGDVPASVVINLCGLYPPGAPQGRVVLGLPFLDALDPSLMPSRTELERFLRMAHGYASERPSYWHCHAGINRSGLAVAAYLHLHRGMRISDAIALLRKRRSRLVLCNQVFERALRTWYGGADEHAFDAVPIAAWSTGRQGARDDMP